MDVGGTVSAGAVTGGTTYGGSSQNSIAMGDQSLLSLAGHYDTPTWQPVSYSFTASAISELISFTSSSIMSNTPSGVPPYLFLDGVSLTQTPEPGSLVLLTFGVIAAIGFRRRLARQRALDHATRYLIKRRSMIELRSARSTRARSN